MSRRMMMGGGGILPAGYTQLEYIQSNGTQFINTGVLVDSNNCIAGSTVTAALTSLVVEGVSYVDYPVICGAVNKDGDYSYTNYQANVINGITPTGNGFSSNIATVGVGDLFTITATAGNATPGRYLALFGKNQGPQGGTGINVSSRASCKMYSATIVYNGELVRNFLPCLRVSDNAVGMYDIVTNSFYGSYNAYNFIAGPIIP